MHILLLDPPYADDGKSTFQEECCLGYTKDKAWSSKLSFWAEANAQDNKVVHIDLRFSKLPIDIADYDKISFLASVRTIKSAVSILNSIDTKLDDKIEVLANMLDEEEAVGTKLFELTGRKFKVISSRISNHIPLGNACNKKAAQSCDGYYYGLSSGCSYGCAHCPWGKHREIWRPAIVVAHDLKWLSTMNPKHKWIDPRPYGGLYMQCAQINSNPAWLDDYIVARKSLGIEKYTFASDMNVLGLNQEVIKKLEKIRLNSAVIGFEVLDDEALKLLDKKQKVDDVIKATTLLKDSTIRISAHFVSGFGETPEMVYNSIDNVKKINALGFKPLQVKIGKMRPYSQIDFVPEGFSRELLVAYHKLLDTMRSCNWPITYYRFRDI